MATSVYFFTEKNTDFSAVFSAFYGQLSVTAAWATRSPWSIVCILYFMHTLNVKIAMKNSTILQGLRVAQAAVTERWP